MAKKHVQVISLGGSIVIPKTGFDPDFLKQFRNLIVRHVKKGTRFVLVVGGGATARNYQQAAQAVMPKISDIDLDWLGIHTTILNAQFVKQLFGDYAAKEVVQDPTKKYKTTKSIIIASGYKPGSSTDLRAVQFAQTYGAGEVINLSNIEYVYTKDPAKHADAERIESIDWASFRADIAGDVWTPGGNAPFDPVASKLAQKLGLRVSILKGTHLKEVNKAISGKSFAGTTIS